MQMNNVIQLLSFDEVNDLLTFEKK